MTNEDRPDRYLIWLYSQIDIPEDEKRWDLVSELHLKQFVWSIPHDDNRMADGVELRSEFLAQHGGRLAEDPRSVSVLEVLIALSRRVSFNDEGEPSWWAWRLIQNLDLHRDRFLDPMYSAEQNEASDILDRLVWRQYAASGQGGFFPLAFPARDQTQVEIWYQMAAYLEEQHPEHG